MNYQLNISIDQTGLSNIYKAAQYVTIVKSVTTNPLASGNLPVAWITFSPWSTNNISWYETYSIYASNTSMQAGATISLTTQTTPGIQLGWTYTLQSGFFTGAPGSTPTFNAANQQQGSTMSTFGLAQPAIVNGANVLAPLNATTVMYNQTASFTPIENVSVFLSSYSNNGVVIAQVASNALAVQLTSQSPVANIGFNDATNTFYLAGVSQQSLSMAEVVGADVGLGDQRDLQPAAQRPSRSR